MTVAIICVLKTGGDFDRRHVNRWMQLVDEYFPPDARICRVQVTDEPAVHGPWPRVSLTEAWPGWWSKIAALRYPGPCLYMDLDVTICGDLTPLIEAAQTHDFIACDNFWAADSHKINSSVMAWRGDASVLYHKFASDPERYMKEYNVRHKWGDQAFIADHWPGKIDTWQNLLPGHVVSYKRGVLKGESMKDARVIVFHGKPRPWDVKGEGL